MYLLHSVNNYSMVDCPDLSRKHADNQIHQQRQRPLQNSMYRQFQYLVLEVRARSSQIHHLYYGKLNNLNHRNLGFHDRNYRCWIQLCGLSDLHYHSPKAHPLAQGSK